MEKKKHIVLIIGTGTNTLGKVMSEHLRTLSNHKGGIEKEKIYLPQFMKESDKLKEEANQLDKI